jgi:hypothetical protein
MSPMIFSESLFACMLLVKFRIYLLTFEVRVDFISFAQFTRGYAMVCGLCRYKNIIIMFFSESFF